MTDHDAFSLREFPKIRHGYIDVLRAGQAKRFIHGPFEVDVTEPRRLIAEHKSATGEALSFTAFVIHNLGLAVNENRLLHAMRRGRYRVMVFDEVDVSTLVEVESEGHKIVKPHIVRAANCKSVRQIHNEIRAAKTARPTDEQQYRGMLAFLTLPRLIRAVAWRLIAGQPKLFKQLGGTVGMSAIGMFAGGAGWGIPISFPTLMVTLGGIEKKPVVMNDRVEVREMLSVTVSVDHDIVDGAPATRFARRLRDLIQSASGLQEAIADAATAGSS